MLLATLRPVAYIVQPPVARDDTAYDVITGIVGSDFSFTGKPVVYRLPLQDGFMDIVLGFPPIGLPMIIVEAPSDAGEAGREAARIAASRIMTSMLKRELRTSSTAFIAVYAYDKQSTIIPVSYKIKLIKNNSTETLESTAPFAVLDTGLGSFDSVSFEITSMPSSINKIALSIVETILLGDGSNNWDYSRAPGRSISYILRRRVAGQGPPAEVPLL